MRSYKFNIYVWLEDSSSLIENYDSLMDLLKLVWKYRKCQMSITWNKAPLSVDIR